MSDEAPDAGAAGGDAGEMVPRSRLNDKERKYQEGVADWSAQKTLLTAQIETLTADRDAAVTARDSVSSQFETMSTELSTMRQKVAFDAAGIRDENMQNAIVGMFNTTPEDKRGDGGLAGWLAAGAYENPLVAPHLPARTTGDPQDAGNAAPGTAPPQTSVAAPTFNANARAAASPPSKFQGHDLLDYIRKQTAGMSPDDKRQFIAAEKRRHTGS